MADLNGFNANTVEPSTAFEAIPAGNYIAAIVESGIDTTSAAMHTLCDFSQLVPHEAARELLAPSRTHVTAR